jgi:hypothetical protein
VEAVTLRVFHKTKYCPSWIGGVARSAGVVVQILVENNSERILHQDLEQPPRLRLRRRHPSYPGGAMGVTENGLFVDSPKENTPQCRGGSIAGRTRQSPSSLGGKLKDFRFDCIRSLASATDPVIA